MKTKEVIKVFISSPNDLGPERKFCKSIVEEKMNALLSDRFNVELEAYLWEDDVSNLGKGLPQKRIPSMEGYQLYLGMLWQRIGTPTGTYDENGVEYPSGTIAEYAEACKCMSPDDIIFLRKIKQVPSNDDDGQLEQVAKFFDSWNFKDKNAGIYGKFKNNNELENYLTNAVFNYVWRHDERIELSSHYKNSGITHLFLPDDSDTRNDSKRDDLKKAKSIRMMAHSGFSYLNNYANRYYKYVEKCLEEGGRVEFILANPFSEMGYYITIGENVQKAATEHIRHEAFDDVAAAIEESSWVRTKLFSAIDGYLELKQRFPDSIELRMCTYEMNSTILITDDHAYMEPYLHCTNSERGMNAFELRIEKVGKPYRAICEYFKMIWDISEDYSVFAARRAEHKDAIRSWYKKGL